MLRGLHRDSGAARWARWHRCKDSIPGDPARLEAERTQQVRVTTLRRVGRFTHLFMLFRPWYEFSSKSKTRRSRQLIAVELI